MALDYQTLLSNADVAGYRAVARPSIAQLLKLALLHQMAKTANPMADLSAQAILSDPNVAGYRAAGATSEVQMLELGLLSIIAGGGSSVTTGAGDPTSVATDGSLYLKTSDNTLWVYNSGWKMLV